jgi:hypothetical protein
VKLLCTALIASLLAACGGGGSTTPDADRRNADAIATHLADCAKQLDPLACARLVEDAK